MRSALPCVVAALAFVGCADAALHAASGRPRAGEPRSVEDVRPFSKPFASYSLVIPVGFRRRTLNDSNASGSPLFWPVVPVAYAADAVALGTAAVVYGAQGARSRAGRGRAARPGSP